MERGDSVAAAADNDDDDSNSDDDGDYIHDETITNTNDTGPLMKTTKVCVLVAWTKQALSAREHLKI